MIVLEPFTEADFPQLIAWIDNERLLKEWSGALFTFPLTEDKLRWYIDGANDLAHSDVFVYKAVDTRTGETVGHISLGSISSHNRSGRITRVLVGRQARGRGYCPAMIKAVLAIGFEQLGLHIITLGVYDFNTAAIRCYRRCGFHLDGTLRHTVRYQNEYWSSVEMSILENEWGDTRPAEAAQAA
jgi:RimJ/RimL family protein N-acetyltransferase